MMMKMLINKYNKKTMKRKSTMMKMRRKKNKNNNNNSSKLLLKMQFNNKTFNQKQLMWLRKLNSKQRI